MTGDDRRLHGAFADLLGTPPAHDDPLAGVHRRVGRMRRRRNVVTGAAASLVVVGAAATIYGVTRPAKAPQHREQVTTQVVVIDPRLSLQVDVTPTVAVGADETVTAVLTGTGEPADRYGWRVAWGDGGLDRVFGSDDCTAGPRTALAVTRVFVHHYVQPGPERLVVELTRCGTVQARTVIPRVDVTAR